MNDALQAGTQLRILADDLTGALDAAGPFATRSGPVAVYWDAGRAAADGRARLALDAATREANREAAIERTRLAARALWVDWRGVAFKKVDSVWRGHPAAEIAAATEAGAFERAIVAPAFPQQGRVTRGGAQWAAEGAGWRCVAPSIADDLRSFGIDARTETDATPSTAAVVCDAETPEDIDAIVSRHWSPSMRTLWCGTRGIAHALAARIASTAQNVADGPARRAALHAPVLVVVGTDHPASVEQGRQLAATPGVAVVTFGAGGDASGGAAADAASASALLWRFAFPAGTRRQEARERIARTLATEVARTPPPGLVIATGGETVRALGDALRATRLDVIGEHEPGVPVAVWGDGRWAGTPMITKSGGFGAGDLFKRVVAAVAPRPPA